MTEDEFRRFYDDTAPALHGYLVRIGGDAALADDLVQSAYVRLLQARAVPEDPRPRRVYLYRIALNLLRDERRRAARIERGEARAQREGWVGGDGAVERQQDEASELSASVHGALGGVGERDRDLLWMAYAVGMTHRELAGVFGVTEPSVRVLLLRARRRFAKVLEARGFGGNRGTVALESRK